MNILKEHYREFEFNRLVWNGKNGGETSSGDTETGTDTTKQVAGKNKAEQAASINKDSIDNHKLRELEENVFQSTVNLEHFYESLEVTYPSYATAVKSELLDLNTIQNRLSKEHQVLVDYFWGDSALFSLVVKEDQGEYFIQPIASVKLLVKNYQQHLLDGPQFTNREVRFKQFSENAYALYKSLFKGVEL